MPLQAPHAEQARLNSSIALIGDGAPARGGSFFRLAAARRMVTPQRAISSCVCRPVAKMEARASLTAEASARSAGKSMMVAGAVGMSPTRRLACANTGRIAVNDCPDWVCGTALAAAAISSATSKTIRCMITPKGCDHAMGSRGGQGFLCVSCRACSSAMATALAQLSVSSFPAQRSRKASAARVRHPASRSRSPWSRQRYSVRASKPKVYRKIASSEGGALVSVICPDYRTEMGVFHGPEGAAQHGRNREIAPSGNSYPKAGG